MTDVIFFPLFSSSKHSRCGWLLPLPGCGWSGLVTSLPGDAGRQAGRATEVRSAQRTVAAGRAARRWHRPPLLSARLFQWTARIDPTTMLSAALSPAPGPAKRRVLTLFPPPPISSSTAVTSPVFHRSRAAELASCTPYWRVAVRLGQPRELLVRPRSQAAEVCAGKWLPLHARFWSWISTRAASSIVRGIRSAPAPCTELNQP